MCSTCVKIRAHLSMVEGEIESPTHGDDDNASCCNPDDGRSLGGL
jgi:hypothetical protein